MLASALDNRIPPPLVALISGLSMWAADFVTPSIHILDIVRFALAGTLFVAAALLGPLAVMAFGRASTTVNPIRIENASTLVTSGIYRVSRNPMYASLATFLVMLAVLLSNLWLLTGPLFFIVFTTRFQIIPEERVMLAKFGDAFLQYRQNVRRWL
jgi:protein-S-isoprenylcysteine O-methyltransferase Ste14